MYFGENEPGRLGPSTGIQEFESRRKGDFIQREVYIMKKSGKVTATGNFGNEVMNVRYGYKKNGEE